MKRVFLWSLGWLFLNACKTSAPDLDVNRQLSYCLAQASKTLDIVTDSTRIPRSIDRDQENWRWVGYRDWTSGFWPGILWYAYDYSKAGKWKAAAERFSAALFPLVDSAAIDHDIGFQLYCSAGNGYRLTGSETYKRILLRGADSLAALFNPKVGTLLSWPRVVPGVDWPLRHNTIMDNMINLELLFWAAKNGGAKYLYDMAVRHALTTMKNQFRPDYTSYHVVVYDTATGQKVKAITHQGYSNSSMWARGQAWAIYGYTMVYRETKDPRFLDFVQKVTDVYLQKLPRDLIPYWDFNDPAVPDAPRDASAAAIVASALLELSTLVPGEEKAVLYREKAVDMLKELSAATYQSGSANNAFLRHSTGHKPNGGEIDASIIYADYYYIEALLRLQHLQTVQNKIEQ